MPMHPVEDEPHSLLSSPSLSPTSPSGTAKHPPVSKRAGAPKAKGSVRAKSGCYTCRIRRKKCDEQPDELGRCATCVRLRLQCLGFGTKRPDWLKENNNVSVFREKIKDFLAAQGMIKGHSGTNNGRPDADQQTLVLIADHVRPSVSPPTTPSSAEDPAVAVRHHRPNVAVSARMLTAADVRTHPQQHQQQHQQQQQQHQQHQQPHQQPQPPHAPQHHQPQPPPPPPPDMASYHHLALPPTHPAHHPHPHSHPHAHPHAHHSAHHAHHPQASYGASRAMPSSLDSRPILPLTGYSSLSDLSPPSLSHPSSAHPSTLSSEFGTNLALPPSMSVSTSHPNTLPPSAAQPCKTSYRF